MVKIAVAGGSGRTPNLVPSTERFSANTTVEVAREVIDALVATKKHEITILSRHVSSSRVPIAEKANSPVKDTRAEGLPTEVVWKVVDYGDKASLTEALQGIHTILSFVQTLWEPEQQTQKNIIDAAIAAGVKRFAPSEFGR